MRASIDRNRVGEPRMLQLSIYTLESHRSGVMEKLNLHNAGQVVCFAVQNGLIH